MRAFPVHWKKNTLFCHCGIKSTILQCPLPKLYLPHSVLLPSPEDSVGPCAGTFPAADVCTGKQCKQQKVSHMESFQVRA